MISASGEDICKEIFKNLYVKKYLQGWLAIPDKKSKTNGWLVKTGLKVDGNQFGY